jgi:hypothetical protein
MPTIHPQRNLDELARLGAEVMKQRVHALLRVEDDGKFVAIDVDAGDYEIDADDYTAVSRLLARRPGADVWLARAGEKAAYRMGRRQ